MPRFTGDALDANLAVVDAVQAVAAQQDATAAQVALAWLRYRADAFAIASAPIPGTRRAARVEENLGSPAVTLTPEQLDTLDAAGASDVRPAVRRSDLGVRRTRIAQRRNALA